MSTFEHDDHDDDRGRDALVHALLQEELGRMPPQDLGDRVRARFAAGEGRAALDRVHAAAGHHDTAIASGSSRRWTLLVAAAALLAVAAVLYESWTRRGLVADDHGTTTPRPVQEPQHQDPQKPKPTETAGPSGPQPKPQQPHTAGPGGPKPRLPIGDLANLRAHLDEVAVVTLEVLSLSDPQLPFRVEVGGTPVPVAGELRRRLLADLATTTERVEPAGADWQNKLVLYLEGGDRFELSIDAYGKDPRVTLHTSGMNGDLRLGVDGSAAITEVLQQATNAACRSHGVARDVADLRSYADAADPSPFTSLRLFDVGGEHLALLRAFPALRRLDLSGMARQPTFDELRLLTKHAPDLEELKLDGLPFADEGMLELAAMVQLKKLSLRRAGQFTGRGFFWVNAGARRRAGPLDVDLTGVTTLTDEGLREVARHDPETLRLGGALGAITPQGAMTLLDTNRLRTLDLTGWPTDGQWAALTAALAKRAEIEVLR